MFKVGDKVKCTDPNDFIESVKNSPLFERYTLPEKGEIYTIREYIPDCFGFKAVLLDEIYNPLTFSGLEVNFNVDLFEKIAVKKKWYF